MESKTTEATAYDGEKKEDTKGAAVCVSMKDGEPNTLYINGQYGATIHQNKLAYVDFHARLLSPAHLEEDFCAMSIYNPLYGLFMANVEKIRAFCIRFLKVTSVTLSDASVFQHFARYVIRSLSQVSTRCWFTKSGYPSLLLVNDFFQYVCHCIGANIVVDDAAEEEFAEFCVYRNRQTNKIVPVHLNVFIAGTVVLPKAGGLARQPVYAATQKAGKDEMKSLVGTAVFTPADVPVKTKYTATTNVVYALYTALVHAKATTETWLVFQERVTSGLPESAKRLFRTSNHMVHVANVLNAFDWLLDMTELSVELVLRDVTSYEEVTVRRVQKDKPFVVARVYIVDYASESGEYVTTGKRFPYFDVGATLNGDEPHDT